MGYGGDCMNDKIVKLKIALDYKNHVVGVVKINNKIINYNAI